MKEFRHGNDDYEKEFKDGLRNGKGKKTFFHDRGKNHIFLEYEGERKDGETVEWNILRQRGKHTFQGCEWKGTEITIPKTNPIISCV